MQIARKKSQRRDKAKDKQWKKKLTSGDGQCETDVGWELSQMYHCMR